MWQPIETLPKKKMVLVVAPGDDGYNLYVGWVCDDGQILADIGYLDERGVKPTHWMEIPDPPRCPICEKYPPRHD